MKELKLGKMTGREIADWMNISYDSTYKRNPTARIEYLKNFCDCEQVRGGAIIKEIYIPYFVKDISEDDKTYLQFVMESPTKLCTIAGMARCLSATTGLVNKKNPEEKNVKNLESIKYRMRKAGVRAFGQTADSDSSSTYGSRHYVWAIKMSDFNEYRFMTEEEELLFIQLNNNYKNNKDGIDFSKEQLYKEAFRKNEISAEIYAKLTVQPEECDDYFNSVIMAFKANTGF